MGASSGCRSPKKISSNNFWSFGKMTLWFRKAYSCAKRDKLSDVKLGAVSIPCNEMPVQVLMQRSVKLDGKNSFVREIVVENSQPLRTRYSNLGYNGPLSGIKEEGRTMFVRSCRINWRKPTAFERISFSSVEISVIFPSALKLCRLETKEEARKSG
eukprot:Lithocolla_globosa_v1_NODE_414_length_4121_cov_4.552878.p3 type:complete len:157 gc:universal NODE_414_length_4121_cov_4.552878:977-507(-)